MDRMVIIWIVLLCAGLIGWLVSDLNSMHINYEWHHYLIEPNTGQKIRPSELLDLGKVIKPTDDYINKTNPMDRLYDLEFNTNLENPFALDQSYSNDKDLELSGWPVADEKECGHQLDWINSKLNLNRDYQLVTGRLGYEIANFLDSFGKPETGLFAGTVTWVGSHKQCQRSSLNNDQIMMRYCQAKLRPTWWPTNETVHPKTRIKMGFCIPETCDTSSFEKQKTKIESILKFDLPEFYKKNLDFDSMFCLPDERSPIRQLPLAGHIYLLVVCTWLAIVLMASILYELSRRFDRKQSMSNLQATENNLVTKIDFESLKCEHEFCGDHLMEEYKFKSIWKAFSIHNSLKEFKADAFRDLKRSINGKVRLDLSCLHFVKISMSIAVVLAHSAYLTSVYTRSISNRIDMNVNGQGHMILSVARCVDTFFMIFGVLTSYTLLKKFTINQLSNPLIWLAVNLGIFLRVSPIFMLVYWYSRSVSPYTGNGPWWDYGVFRYSMKGNCLNEPWWKSIPYFGCSGSPPVATCLLPGWFIVSYTQLSLIMPLIIYLIYKLPNHISRHLLIAFTSIISGLQLVLKMNRQTSFREEAFTMYGGFLADLAEKFESTGTMATLGRVGCVTTGCYIGYLLRMYELERIRHWPRWLTNKFTIAWAVLMHFIIIFLPLIGLRLLKSNNHATTLGEFLGSYLSTMFLWPILNSIVLVNCAAHYHHTAFVRLLSHSFWRIFNKLGLCIFLVHWEVIFVGMTSFEQAPSMGFITDIIKTWSFGVFFSILISLVIHILFEAPLTAVLKLLLDSFMGSHGKPDLKQSVSCDNKQTVDS